MSGKKIKEILDSMKDMKITGDTVTIMSALKDSEYIKLKELSENIAESIQN